jgi:hypothetical protein
MFAETLRVYLEKTYTVVGLAPDGHAVVFRNCARASTRLRKGNDGNHMTCDACTAAIKGASPPIGTDNFIKDPRVTITAFTGYCGLTGSL